MGDYITLSTVDDDLVAFLNAHYLTSLVYTRAIIEMALIGDPIVIKYEENGRVIGCITGTLQKDTRGDDYIFVNFLCVDRNYRKQGLANRLKRKLLETAINKYPNAHQMYAVYTISTDLQTGTGSDVSVNSFERVCQDEYYHYPINPDVFENVNLYSKGTATEAKKISSASSSEKDTIINLLNSRRNSLYRMYTNQDFTELYLSEKCMRGYIIYDCIGNIIGFISYYKIYNRVLDITVGQVCEIVGDKQIVLSYLVESLIRTKEIDMLNYTSTEKLEECGFIKGSSKLTWYTWGYKDTRIVESVGLVSI